jgi:NAD(P)-dependent dehydrogenase (short-subunit alcohol dehydrogenase family)
MKEKYTGKVVVVSGSFGYVGFAITKELANKGFIVAGLYNKTSEETIQQKISALTGDGHRFYRCDINNEEVVAETLEVIEKEVGPIYACVHTAGEVPIQKKLFTLTGHEFNEQITLGIRGSFNFLSHCSRKIKDNKGVIIGITTAGVVTEENTKPRGVYSVIKYALQGMLVSLRDELRGFGVRVYSVAPGVLPFGLNKDTPRGFIELYKQSSPTKDIATAEDVAKEVVFLCKEESKHVTDMTILIAPETGSAHNHVI